MWWSGALDPVEVSVYFARLGVNSASIGAELPPRVESGTETAPPVPVPRLAGARDRDSRRPRGPEPTPADTPGSDGPTRPHPASATYRPIPPSGPISPIRFASVRTRFHPGVLAVIGLGGAAGTLGRAAVAYAFPASTDAFPWATLMVNLIGSLAVGLVVVAALERVAPSRYFRPLLGIGLCGGLTTFSTFLVEADLLIKNGRAGIAAFYVVVSLIGGLAAVRIGMGLARSAWSREAG